MTDQRARLRRDLLAGLTTEAMVVPQVVTYASLADAGVGGDPGRER
jgi:MFS superfamily sulfate permease-like transporter